MKVEDDICWCHFLYIDIYSMSETNLFVADVSISMHGSSCNSHFFGFKLAPLLSLSLYLAKSSRQDEVDRMHRIKKYGDRSQWKGFRVYLGGKICSISSTVSYKSTKAKQIARQEIEYILPPNRRDDLCLCFSLQPSPMMGGQGIERWSKGARLKP